MTTRMHAVLGVLMLCISPALFSQNVISGFVLDESGKVLPGAAVIQTGHFSGTISDAKGFYRLPLQGGEFKLTSSYIGYEPVTVSVRLEGKPLELNFVLKARDFITDEVVITATRADKDAPISQVTRSRKDLERIYTGQDGAFLLEELSPSIVSYSESGTGLSNYGGLRLRGMDQTRINMTLNGVPLNDMMDQGVFFSNFTDFGNSIESVQIQRGVGTSSNGTSSYAGSINFESMGLLDAKPSAEVQLTGGSFNTRRFSAEASTGLMQNKTSLYVRYAQVHSDGFRDNASTDSRSFFASGAVFRDRHTFKLTAFSGLSANGLAYGPVAISDIEANPRTNYVSPNDRDNFGQWMGQFQHIFALSRDWSLVNTLYYSGAGGDFPFGFQDEDGAFMQINYPLFNDHIGAMSAVNGEMLEGKLKLNGGVHGYSFFRRNKEQIVPNFDNPYYSDKSRKNELSAFAKAAYTLGSFELFGDVQVRGVQLQLTPDNDFLGFDANIPDRDWLFINPKAGVTYRIDNKWQAYASLGRTGREPTRFDILGATQINLSNLPLVAELGAVVPEYVNDLEVGARFGGSQLQLQVNAFFMQFENEIAPTGEFIEEGFVQIFRNQESSRRAGLEVDYTYKISPVFRLLGNATYMHARIESYTPDGGTTVRNVSPILSPEWNVQTTLEASITKDVTLSLRTRYLSEAYMELTNNPDLVVPESFVTDLRLRYRFYKEHVLSLQFNNVFDSQYFTYGAPVFTEAGLQPGFFVQPPRHLYATLHLKF